MIKGDWLVLIWQKRHRISKRCESMSSGAPEMTTCAAIREERLALAIGRPIAAFLQASRVKLSRVNLGQHRVKGYRVPIYMLSQH